MLSTSDSIRLEAWESDKLKVRTSSKNKAFLLLTIVERVKKLQNVVVKSTSFINDDDELVVVPGPWAIVKPVSPIPAQRQFDDAVEDEDDSAPGTPITSPPNRFRALSTAASAAGRHRAASSPVVSPSKYVIRNEFGHARIQQYLAHPEHRERSMSGDSSDSNGSHHQRQSPTAPAVEELFETGGHVVLHPDVFQACIEKGWGIRHPLAGHYHPITGTQIPPTTMLFRAPTTQQELEVIWNVVVSSYLWVIETSKD